MKRKLSLKLFGMPYEVAVALAYLLIAGLWIFFSDRALAVLVHDPEQFVTLSLYKGWIYTGVTGVLLYSVLHHIFQHIRLVQKDLSESESRYRILIENQTDLVVKIDLDGHFLFVSPSCSQLFGKPEDVLLGQLFVALVHEGDQASIKVAWETLFKSPHKAYVEQRTVTAKGLRWLAWQYTGLLDAEGSVQSVVGVGRDITERKESEDALRESESKMHEAQQIAKIGRWDLDFVSNKLEWSEEIYALLEISREDYSPAYETMLSFIHPDDRDRLDQAFQKARKNKTVYKLEHRMLMPDGRIKWVSEIGRFEYDDLGVPFKGFGTAQDITERKLAEQALSESEKNFEAITNQSTLGITVADLEGLYTFVNPAFCEMMGYSSEELLQKSVFDVKAKGQDHGTFDRTKNSEEGIPVQVVLARKDGVEFVAEVVGKVVSISGEQRVLGIVSDITRRQQAEDSLRDNEMKYRELAENTAAILWEYDVTKDRWTYVAPQVERILGYAPEEWTDFEFWASHLHEEDREWAVKYCGDCSGRGEAHDFEYRFLKKNGEVIWLRDIVDVELKDGAAVVLRGLMIDITERKQSEVELRQARQLLEATLDAIPDLLFEMGLDSQIYDYHSPRTDLLFVPPENFIGKKMTEVLPAEAASVVMAALAEAHEQGRSSGNQYALLLEQGTRWFEISISGKPHAEGDAPRFIAISRDITQRKQAEQAYYESEAKYRTFFENSADPMLIIEKGEFVDCNSAAVAVFGYGRKEEILRLHPAKLSPDLQPDGCPSLDKADEIMRLAKERGSHRFEWNHLRKDGSIFQVEVSLTAIDAGQGGQLHTVFRDISKRRQAEEVARGYSTRLLELQRVTHELSRLDSFDDLCRQSIVLGRSKLGFERLGLWFVDNEPGQVRGSFGTDEQGNLRDEREARLSVAADSPMGKILSGGEPLFVLNDDPLQDNKTNPIGQAPHALAALTSDDKLIGILSADNLFSQAPFSDTDIQLLALYASTVGYLCRQKKAEEVARGYSTRLLELQGVTHELSRADSFDDLCRKAVEVGRSKIGFERLGLWFVDNEPGQMRGSFGIDEQGNLLDEREARLPVTADSPMGRIVLDGESLFVRDTAPLLDDKANLVEQRPYALAALTSDGKLIGILSADNLFSQAPFSDTDIQLLALYASTIGYLCRQKQAEEEKERLLAAINQASETVLITDVEGTIQYVNPAFEKVSGYTREEVIGKNSRVFKSGEQDPAFYRAMWKVLVAGETWSGRLANRKKDGTLYTEEVTISPVKDATGKTVNYVAIKADITTTLAWEAQYRQTQKLESVGRLAGGVAHDFNNILQTITGFCGLILAEMDAKSAQRPDVIEIQKATHLAGELTQQLLAFSRKRPTQYKVIDLNTILSSGKKMLQQALDEDMQLQFNLEGDLKQVCADSAQMLQVAMNLMVNARDAMPNGGTILVDTKNIKIEEADLSKDPNSRMGEFVRLTVSDTGCGMDAQQLGHLFEPFYTTKPIGQGTGLGLSVVYGIVKEHSGWIAVSSKPESGSIFQVYLPVHDGVYADSGPCEGEASAGKRILLVTDDSVVRQLTGEILQDMGYIVAAVENGIEAEEVMLLKRGAFDLLFSERVLPEQNGIELAESCLKHNSGVAVLLFGEEDEQDAKVKPIIERGFNYIQTPFNLNKLLRVVERSIGKRRNPQG